MRVLITGLFEPGALAALRRFGELGAEITAADCHRLSYGMYSKYVRRRIVLPSLREKPAEYARKLLAELTGSSYDYYFPGYEEIVLMSQLREQVLDNVQSVLPPYETLLSFHDKSRLAHLAERAGVATPTVWRPAAMDDVRQLAGTIKGPVAIKLRRGAGASGLRVARDASALPKLFQEVVESNDVPPEHLPIVEQWLDGETVCSLELCQRGQVLGEVFYRGVRTMPRHAGTTVLRETVVAPACAEAARALVGELDYTGFVGFDFVMKDGVPFVVDANPRMTPALNLAQQAGCDMVPAWLALADGHSPEPLSGPRIGTRTRIQFGETMWLLESLFRSLRYWDRERELRRGWWRDARCPDDVATWRDPLPNIMLWGYVLTSLPRVLLSKVDTAELFMYHNHYIDHEPYAVSGEERPLSHRSRMSR